MTPRLYTRALCSFSFDTPGANLLLQAPPNHFSVVIRDISMARLDNVVDHVRITILTETLTPTTASFIDWAWAIATGNDVQQWHWSGTLVMPSPSNLALEVVTGSVSGVISGWVLPWPTPLALTPPRTAFLP